MEHRALKLAIIGAGKMGRLVSDLACAQGDQVVRTFDMESAGLSAPALALELKTADAVIDFSLASAVARNVEACARARVPVVVGATGWYGELTSVSEIVAAHDGALVYGPNFSVGVNLFFRILEFATEAIAAAGSYYPFVEETHHMRKLDAPSGTALKLIEIVEQRMDAQVSVASTRAGFFPGTHKVGFDSEADTIELVHTARKRDGFAAGALLAAHWLVGKTGVFEFSQVIDDMVASATNEVQRFPPSLTRRD